jgi:hypothetical protein
MGQAGETGSRTWTRWKRQEPGNVSDERDRDENMDQVGETGTRTWTRWQRHGLGHGPVRKTGIRPQTRWGDREKPMDQVGKQRPGYGSGARDRDQGMDQMVGTGTFS